MLKTLLLGSNLTWWEMMPFLIFSIPCFVWPNSIYLSRAPQQPLNPAQHVQFSLTRCSVTSLVLSSAWFCHLVGFTRGEILFQLEEMARRKIFSHLGRLESSSGAGGVKAGLFTVSFNKLQQESSLQLWEQQNLPSTPLSYPPWLEPQQREVFQSTGSKCCSVSR